MAILHGFAFQALLLMNDISVMLYSVSNNRWRPSVSAPAFTTGYGDWYWANSNYGHTVGIDPSVR